MSDKILIIETTIDDIEKAEEIVSVMVGEKLVACAQISSPIKSIYTWKGKLCVENEVRIVFKGLLENKNKIKDRLKALHPYDVAEILLAEKECVGDYFQWVRDVCTTTD